MYPAALTRQESLEPIRFAELSKSGFAGIRMKKGTQ
jgi:hypothetical protein